MNVEILNPEETKDLFKYWGMASCVCYDTKTETPEKIGKHCMNSQHFSGSRGQYILFKITGCPRFTIDQAVRHEVGVMKNVQSFRYVNKDAFSYEVPEEIENDSALLIKYHTHMVATMELYAAIQEYVLDRTGSQERANEQARHVLPMATHGAFVIGMTIEALIHFMHKRLCARAEDKIRELAIKMRTATLGILPELNDNLIPICQSQLWCPEANGCGAYPNKKRLKEILFKKE